MFELFEFYMGFLYPKASNLSIQWLNDVLDARWEAFLIGLFFSNLVLLGYFYFFTKPTPKGMLRFWIISCISVIAGTIMGFVNLYENQSSLFMEGVQWTFQHTIATIAASLFSSIEMLIIILVVFWAISLIPIHWNLRAMRRYPIKRIP